jgi:hypothetical protein
MGCGATCEALGSVEIDALSAEKTAMEENRKLIKTKRMKEVSTL